MDPNTVNNSGQSTDQDGKDTGDQAALLDQNKQGEQDATNSDKDGKDTGAPETYDFKVPEGKDFSPEVLGAFSEVAKELNLSQADAQKVLDKIAPAFEQHRTNVMQEARGIWRDTARTDKEIGGDKLNENLATANKALREYGTPELRGVLDQSGLIDHPEIMRLLLRVGKTVKEDGTVISGGSVQTPSTLAKQIFPSFA